MSREVENIKEIKTRVWLKWGIYLALIYGLYVAVYLYADHLKIMMGLGNIRKNFISVIATHIDVPLILGMLLLALVFDYRRTLESLLLDEKKKWLAMLAGVAVFLCGVMMTTPANAVDGYWLIHKLVTVAFLGELAFRVLLFDWMDAQGLGRLAYLLSGLCGGALSAVQSVVVDGATVLFVVVPAALSGMVLGTIMALVYKKTKSLWLITYLQASLLLFMG